MKAKGRLFLGRLSALFWLFANSHAALAQVLPSSQAVEAFFNAIQENDTNTALALLGADTNLVRATYYGRLPLHVAASTGMGELVQELLRNGADINAASDTLDTVNAGLTALAAAVWYGHTNVCSLLLEWSRGLMAAAKGRTYSAELVWFASVGLALQDAPYRQSLASEEKGLVGNQRRGKRRPVPTCTLC